MVPGILQCRQKLIIPRKTGKLFLQPLKVKLKCHLFRKANYRVLNILTLYRVSGTSGNFLFLMNGRDNASSYISEVLISIQGSGLTTSFSDVMWEEMYHSNMKSQKLFRKLKMK